MDPAEYAKMYNVEETYWWFQGRKKIVVQTLEALAGFNDPNLKVLDLGCGTGLMLDYLRKKHLAIGLDFSPLALKFSHQRGIDRLVQGDVQHMPIQSNSVGIITALDIAEHIPRDDLFFCEILRILKPGGRLLLTVPAHPILWSSHDEALHHFRRYTRRELEGKIRNSGLRLTRMTYCITFTFLPILVFRLLQKALHSKKKAPKTHLIQLPRWANRLVLATVELEAYLLRFMNLPFGVTLMAVAEKQ